MPRVGADLVVGGIGQPDLVEQRLDPALPLVPSSPLSAPYT